MMFFFDDHPGTTSVYVFNHTNPLQNMSVEEYRQKLSDQMATTLLPAMIVLGILMLVGFVGNSLVFHVYLMKVPQSATRPTILALACFDLITCVVSIPGEILDIRYSYNFMSNQLCKSFRFTTTILLLASGLTLLLVALDRYQRICHPLRNQATISTVWMRVAGACLIAFVLSILAPLVHSRREIETPEPGIMGMECSTDPGYKVLAFVHNVLLGVVFLTAFTIMSVVYILIGRRVLRQNMFRTTAQRRMPSRLTINTIDEDSGIRKCNGERACNMIPDPYMISTSNEDDVSKSNERSLEEEVVKDETCDMDASRNGSNHPRKQSVFKHIRSSSLDATTRRTTLMLFLITLVFVISFVPHIVISVIQTATKSLHSHGTSDVDNIIYNIFVRSYFINAATNPFIYGFCSPLFCRECKKLILGCFFWRQQRTRSSSYLPGA